MTNAFSALHESEAKQPPNNHRWARRIVATRVKTFASRTRKVLGKRMPEWIQHGLFFGGIGSIAFGFWMMYHPLGPIVGGGLGVWVSFLMAAERNESRS